MSLVDAKSVPRQGRGASWQLVDRIRDQIANGEYTPGDRLPSYRKLMNEYDLTLGTVSHAMSILAQQGRIDRRHGSGVFVEEKVVQSLEKTTTSDLFALVVPDIDSGIYQSLQAGMEQASKNNQEHLITATTNWDVAQQADVLFQLIDRGISGVALVPPAEATYAHQLRTLQKAGVPLVLLHRGVPGIRAPRIVIPFLEVGRLAGAAIAQQGHRHVAAFMVNSSQVSDLYISGLRQGLQENNSELADEHIYWGSSTPPCTTGEYLAYGETVEGHLTQMLDSPNRPTAVFACLDRIAEMVYQAAEGIGLRVPDDLSLVCFGGKQRSGAILPRLTTVAIDEQETGRMAHKLLASMSGGSRPLDDNETFTMPLAFDTAKTLGPSPNLRASREKDGSTNR